MHLQTSDPHITLRNQTGLTFPQEKDHVSHVETHSKIRSRLFINSEERLTNTGYDEARYFSGSSIIKSPITKIGLESFKMSIAYPNVNSRNNVITFFSSVSAINHSVTLDTAFYTIPDLMTEIQAKLNSVTGASGLTFTITVFPGSLNSFEITVAGGSYRFVSSSHIDRARPLSGLFAFPTVTNQPVVVVSLGFYTRFIDVVCNDLRDGIHLPNLFSGENTISNSGHIFRIFVDDYTEAGVNKLYVNKDVKLPIIQYSSFRPKQLQNLSITLTDEFNEALFSPDQTVGGLTQNIKYVDYFLTFALE